MLQSSVLDSDILVAHLFVRILCCILLSVLRQDHTLNNFNVYYMLAIKFSEIICGLKYANMQYAARNSIFIFDLQRRIH